MALTWNPVRLQSTVMVNKGQVDLTLTRSAKGWAWTMAWPPYPGREVLAGDKAGQQSDRFDAERELNNKLDDLRDATYPKKKK